MLCDLIRQNGELVLFRHAVMLAMLGFFFSPKTRPLDICVFRVCSSIWYRDFRSFVRLTVFFLRDSPPAPKALTFRVD